MIPTSAYKELCEALEWLDQADSNLGTIFERIGEGWPYYDDIDDVQLRELHNNLKDLYEEILDFCGLGKPR
jgi:hypothetical protein